MKNRATSFVTQSSMSDHNEGLSAQVNLLKQHNRLSINRKKLLKELFQHEKGQDKSAQSPYNSIIIRNQHGSIVDIADSEQATNNPFFKAKLIFLMNCKQSGQQELDKVPGLCKKSSGTSNDEENDEFQEVSDTVTFKALRKQELNKNKRMIKSLKNLFHPK